MKALKAHHEKDPKDVIWETVGDDINGLDIFHNTVLVGIYIRPEKLSSGLYMPDKSRDEEKFQGKVGLVLKKGPAVFKDDPDAGIYFYGQDINVGEWIGFMPSDGWPVKVGELSCRIVRDTDIKMRVQHPDFLY